MKIGVNFDGADRLAQTLGKLQNAAQGAALDQAMTSTATTILNESKKIVPVDKGTLKNSGRVEPVKRTQNSIEVEITYGGAAAAYAVYVHEDPSARHAEGKTYKFLEIPVMAHKDKFVREVMQAFATYLRRV